MKKLLSLTLALVMLLTSVFVSQTAYADSASSLTGYVDKQINSIVKTLTPQNSTYTLSSASYLYDYIAAGCDMTKCKDEFVNSVKSALSENSGTLPTTESYGYNMAIGEYASTIKALDYFGYDPSSFEGVNLVAQFEALDLGDVNYNPYNYKAGIKVATEYCNDAFAKKLADDLIGTYYKAGAGMDYWGYSCDNTAMFITAISPLKDELTYKLRIDDAIKLLPNYELIDGFAYDPVYGASADSTAYALMAYASVGNAEKSFSAYKKLVENFEKGTGELGNTYSLVNCLAGLSAYRQFLSTTAYAPTEHIFKQTVWKDSTCKKAGEVTKVCVLCSLSQTEYFPRIDHKVVKDKAVSATYFKSGLTAGSHCSVCKTVITKQKSVAKKKPSISKLTKGKKSIKVNWKNISGVTGYQIQIATDKKFTKNKKSIKVKGASKKSYTAKNLKAKKTYYVRMRVYKTSSGKTSYSPWSATKSIKTK